MHKKHLLPGFDDSIGDEQSIERLTEQITMVRYMPVLLDNCNLGK